jgi:hypothetical protein
LRDRRGVEVDGLHGRRGRSCITAGVGWNYFANTWEIDLLAIGEQCREVDAIGIGIRRESAGRPNEIVDPGPGSQSVEPRLHHRASRLDDDDWDGR